MKKQIVLFLALVLSVSMFSGCQQTGSVTEQSASEIQTAASEVTVSVTEQSVLEDSVLTEETFTGNYTDEMKIPYTCDLDEAYGADSVEREGDHEDSPYFTSLDYYNMESTSRLSSRPANGAAAFPVP
jgi:hypothetical protein